MESRFEHYFQLIDSDDLDEVIEVIDNCEKHHCLFYIYDIGISFSGKQREEARKIAEVLEEGGAKVFFDEFNKADLIGRDLVDEFYTVFSRECRYVLILVSKDYLEESGHHTNMQRQRKGYSKSVEQVIFYQFKLMMMHFYLDYPEQLHIFL